MNRTNGRQWFLLCLSVVECLLCTGVTFGLSALTIALKRDGQFAETCGGAEGATMLEGEGEEDALPEGWEMKIRPKDGKIYYVNHKDRTTSWTRPKS